MATPAGVPAAQRSEHGVGGHLGRVSLADGRGHLVVRPMLDTAFLAERDVSEARWSGPYPYREVVLAPALQAQLQEPLRQHECLAPDRYAPEAAAFLVAALNRCIALFKQDKDVSHLMPEVVMSMNTAHADPARWAQLGEWLDGLAGAVAGMVGEGTLSGPVGRGWFVFLLAYSDLNDRARPPVNPVEVAWVRH